MVEACALVGGAGKSRVLTATKIPLLFLLMPPTLFSSHCWPRPFLSFAWMRTPSFIQQTYLCPLLLSSSIHPSTNSLLRRPGPCSRDNERTLETKSIDDAGRSSSFNPHRARWNPLVYHAEIKSLPAVAKSIIL